ncbi:autoinducer synthase [Roseiarcus fermentans]|uniref:Autoinducer synthase n=1 Tax=Roseiarcus fermentans TaxID=1473586 RepID=A0A366FCZ4_9HYPH|nr:acyl-homoserine-lactone synthase [Roseiarcus fermentans]RBP11956.1 autoinducer synthase [Roseiarcus fermentans]
MPARFLTDMAVNRALTRTFAIGDEFLDDRGLDAFDDDDAIYVIAFDRVGGAYLGSVRLRPTVKSTLLRDAAPYLLEFGETIESPRIWELSRLCTTTRSEHRRRHGADAVAGELAAAAFEVAGRAGVNQFVCVTDDPTFHALERIGCAPKLKPRPASGPGSAPHVVFLDVGQIPLKRIQNRRAKAAMVEFRGNLAERR